MRWRTSTSGPSQARWRRPAAIAVARKTRARSGAPARRCATPRRRCAVASRRRRGRRRDAEALGVGRRRARRAGAGAGTAAPARPRPRARPRASGTCRGAARRWRGAAAGGASSSNGPAGRGRARRGLLALGPAHAAAADLVERQAGVERHRVEQLRARPCAPVSTPRSMPSALGELGDHLPLGARPRPGGRSRGAGAGGARRGGRPCPPSRRRTRPGRRRRVLAQPVGEEAARARSPSCALLERARPTARGRAGRERVGVQQVERGQLAVGRPPRRSRRRRGRRAGAGASPGRRRQQAGLAQPAAVGAGRDLEQAGAVAAGEAERARRRSAARARRGRRAGRRSGARPRGSRRPRRRPRSAVGERARRPSRVGAGGAAQRRRRRRRRRRARRRARRANASPAPGAIAQRRSARGVERVGRARRDDELHAVAAHALADAQVEDRRVVDRARCRARARRARTRGPAPSPAAPGAAERALRRRGRARRRARESRSRGAERLAQQALRAGSPPRWSSRRRPARPPRAPALLERRRGGVERALPARPGAARRRRARSGSVMRSSTWIAW